MSTPQADTVVTLTIGQLEALIRRVVREELAQYQVQPANPADDWRHEGPGDPEGDEILAREALAQLEEIKKDPSRVRSFEEFEGELLVVEACGE
jgi:hypothetical protein